MIYASVDELKARMRIASGDTADDAALAAVLEQVSRWIDDHCNRNFEQSEAGVVKRFTPTRSDRVIIADLVSATKVETDPDRDRTYADEWAATDYDLLPFDAETEGRPYWEIRVAPGGEYLFPTVSGGLRITGTWGWPVVPAPVQAATLLQAHRLFKRGDAIFGVVGSSETGSVARISGLDVDVRNMLKAYLR